ncbi:MAG: helix-turn-helix domain-containing protein [Vicinamibacteria bacterium]|nr:helix-turn-helix domain-containing protein [Vicinamibacteria bacterium]
MKKKTAKKQQVTEAPQTAEFLITQEAARLLRAGKGTLQNWRVAGTGPRYYRAGKRVLYRREDLLEFAQASK